MTNFSIDPKLVKRSSDDGTEYILRATTTTLPSAYIADGYNEISEIQSDSGHYEIQLNIREGEGPEEVEHEVDLGFFPFPDSGATLEVIVFDNSANDQVTSGTVHVDQAEEDKKPGPNVVGSETPVR